MLIFFTIIYLFGALFMWHFYHIDRASYEMDWKSNAVGLIVALFWPGIILVIIYVNLKTMWENYGHR